MDRALNVTQSLPVEPGGWFARALAARGLSCAMAMIVIVVACSCSKTRDGSQPAETRVMPPPPPDLVAEIVVRNPQATWDTLRAELGSQSNLLPRSLSLFVISTLALPIVVADELDLASPIYAAADRQGDDTGFVFAIHTRSGSSVKQTLVRSALQDAGPPAPFVFDVAGEYLVIANGARSLTALAPYAARTLPMRASARHDVTLALPRTALGGPILRALRRSWESWRKEREAEDQTMRAKHAGSAPDFGDPTEALSDLEGKASRIFAVLGDLDELRGDIDFEPAAHVARLNLTYRPLAATGPAAEEIAGMDTGDGEPVLALPHSSLVAMVWRDSEATRLRSAEQQSEGIAKVLGSRLSPADRAKVDSALATWAQGRGDWLAAGVVWSESVRAVVLRSAMADADAIGRAPEKILELLSIPAVAQPLASWFGDLKVSPTSTLASAEGTPVRKVHVVRRPPRRPEVAGAAQGKNLRSEPEPFDVLWHVGKEVFVGAAGQSASTALAALQPGSEEPKLGDNPDVAGAVRHLGKKIAFLAVADPSRLFGAARLERISPIVLAYGRSHTELTGHARGWVELQLPTPTIVDVLSQRMNGRAGR